MDTGSLNIKRTHVFKANWESVKRIVVNRGGTRSSKTYSLCQILCLWLITGYIGESQKIEKGYASIVRKTLPALRATAYRDVVEILKEWGWYKHTSHNKTDRIISFRDRNLEFFSVDDQQKVRGRKRNILYCNEANELDFKNDFYQMLIRTTDKVFLDFNPDDPDIWINKEIEQKRAIEKGDVDVIVSNYTWNGFLEPELIAEIEYTKKVDPELWEVFGRGNYGKLTGLIFPNIKLIDSFPDNLDTVFYGLDFGFNDPQAFIKIGVNGKDLYLHEMYYERFKTNAEFISFLKTTDVNKRDIIYGDSSRPGSIQEIYNAGYKGIKPSKKGKDSVKSGLVFMKGFNIHITQSSTNLIKERRKYKWATDKNGEPIEGTPVDKDNHAMDGSRYGVFTHLYEPKRSFNIA